MLSISGSKAATLGAANPIRYRGYVYDTETGLYYLQSRYYNPKTGRFLNADGFTSTGQGILGNNMFAYCGNNPVNLADYSGNLHVPFFPVASYFLTLWLEGDGRNQSFDAKSFVCRAIRKSHAMKKLVSEAISDYDQNGGTGVYSDEIEFTVKGGDADLYYAIQHCSYSIRIHKEEQPLKVFTPFYIFDAGTQIRYVAEVSVSDVYNFDKMRNWDSLGNILNNLAYIAHSYSVGRDFDWNATYTFYGNWRPNPKL